MLFLCLQKWTAARFGTQDLFKEISYKSVWRTAGLGKHDIDTPGETRSHKLRHSDREIASNAGINHLLRARVHKGGG
jgi:hypothetical protein